MKPALVKDTAPLAPASDWYAASLKAAAYGDHRTDEQIAREGQDAAQAAVADLRDGDESRFRFRYSALDGMIGAVPQGAAILLYARTGNGKTTFVSNVVDDELLAGRGVTMIPTESTPREVLSRWAMFRVGEESGYWLSKSAHRDRTLGVLSDMDFTRRRDAIIAEMETLEREYLRQRQCLIATAPHVTPDIIRRAFYRAKAEGHSTIVIDHIDLIKPDRNVVGSKYDASVAATDLLLELLQETGMTALVCSQTDSGLVKGSVISQYDPPTLGNAYNGQHKNHMASFVLGLFRVRKPNLDANLVSRINDRQASALEAFEPNRMGVIKNKDRIFGRDGQRCALALEHGRLRDLTPDELRDTEAGTHAIRTNRDIAR